MTVNHDEAFVYQQQDIMNTKPSNTQYANIQSTVNKEEVNGIYKCTKWYNMNWWRKLLFWLSWNSSPPFAYQEMQINLRKRYDFYFKSFLRTIKLSLSGTIDVCTSWFIVTDIIIKGSVSAITQPDLAMKLQPVRTQSHVFTAKDSAYTFYHNVLYLHLILRRWARLFH